jgi:adenylate cyclase class IV
MHPWKNPCPPPQIATATPTISVRKSVHDSRAPLKYRIPKTRGAHDPVRVLHEQGFLAHPAVEHEDTWFERPEGPMLGSIVLRRVLPDGAWTMAWETTIRTGNEAERHYLWTKVDGPAMWARLERLGMRPVTTLRSTRVALNKGPHQVALERVKRMGDFLELPGIGRDGALRREFLDALRHLGATVPEPRSYRELFGAPSPAR